MFNHDRDPSLTFIIIVLLISIIPPSIFLLYVEYINIITTAIKYDNAQMTFVINKGYAEI